MIWANPYSKGTDPICRLPLVTFKKKDIGKKPKRPDAVIRYG